MPISSSLTSSFNMLSNLFKYLPKPNFSLYWPLYFQEEIIGWIHQDNIDIIANYPELFQLNHATSTVTFTSQFICATFDERNTFLANFSEDLRLAGIITNWRDEAYGVYRRKERLQNALFTIERGVAPFLGFRVFGVHINGYVEAEKSDQISHIWVAQRSKLKRIEPHKLDNIAAGGLSYGEIPLVTAKREAMEEANIPETATEALSFVTPFNYLTEHNKSIRDESIFIFDLPIPPSFEPQINDGEVEAFHALTSEEVMAALLDGEKFKPNSGLVTLHFLLRHQLTQLSSTEQQYLSKQLNLSPSSLL